MHLICVLLGHNLCISSYSAGRVASFPHALSPPTWLPSLRTPPACPQLNPGCSGSTFRKQFSHTMAKMSPEEAERGMRWLAKGLAG